MDLEAKLDEDFLFYLGFTNTFLRRVSDPDQFKRCRVWIYKLCAEPCMGVHRKRCRNIYLTQLLISMQNNNLEQVFMQSPIETDITNATEVFGPIPSSVTNKQPDWLNDTEYHVETELPKNSSKDNKGRTYIATRTLPDGQGAFAYIGVSLTDEEPFWFGGGAGDTSVERREAFDRKMEEKFKEYVPPTYEMEKILAKRKDPKEREKVLTFYDVLMQTIADELDGLTPEINETVEGLLEQLVEDLRTRGLYETYEAMPEETKRMELLMMLYDRVRTRRDKVAKREEILDDIEQKIMPQSFFETSVAIEDKYELPAAMWQQAIDKLPNKKQMERLQMAYPLAVVERFLDYLADYKEQIAERVHRRHENMVAQMKKELRKEGKKKKKSLDETEQAYANAGKVFQDVKNHYLKVKEMENKNKNIMEVELSDHSKMYEQMKATIFDAQKLVEDEAARGKFLANQINAVSEQSELFNQMNVEVMKNTEEANMKIMRNIKRLTAAVKQYETRIQDIKQMSEQLQKTGQQKQMMFY